MSVIFTEDNLFDVKADILVNTVNTVGVMGAGVALECKKRYPDMYYQYRMYCNQGLFDIGKLWLFRKANPAILCFPTKKHWRNDSKYEYIEEGLDKFVSLWSTYNEQGYESIAFPPLGCGNGNLDFKIVRRMLENYLTDLEGTFYVCSPR